MPKPATNSSKEKKRLEREARLAQNLRKNLRRRKSTGRKPTDLDKGET